MQKIENGFADEYFLTEDGKVYNAKLKRFLKADKRNYSLMTTENKRKSISIKKLYKLVYNKNYCIDNTKSLPNEVWREIEGTDKNYYCSNQR